jgi:hypothetical protein
MTQETRQDLHLEKLLCVVSAASVKAMLRCRNTDVFAVYLFLYYTAKRQRTNQPKCTVGFISKGLKMSRQRVWKAKKDLAELGLIENIRRVDPVTKRLAGWYVRLNYIWKQETVENMFKTEEFSSASYSRAVELQSSGNQTTNALSGSSKMLKVNKGNAFSFSESMLRIFSFWNEQAVLKHHRELTPEMEKEFRKSGLTEEEVIRSISNYVRVLSDPDSFFTYRWSLVEFLGRKNAAQRFLADDVVEEFKQAKRRTVGAERLTEQDIMGVV